MREPVSLQDVMITIKEIAAKLGLSTTTVSNVINGKTGEVSPDTIAKVQNFLDEVGYVPNFTARNLARNSSHIIGLVLKTQNYKFENILSDPFVSEMVGGIEEAVRSAGYMLMIYISDDIAEILNKVSAWNADGLILFCMLDDDGIRVSEKYKKPVVCIDTYSDEKMNYVNIGLEDEQGGYEAARYLISQGHRRIAFLSDNRVGVDLMRFRGYRRALSEAGIEYSDRNFFLLNPEKAALAASLRRLCKKAADYTAIFCTSDLYAALFTGVLIDHGIRVPDDISIVGFDDNKCSRMIRPALTTIHQDAPYKGRLAAETLIGLIEGKASDPQNIVLKPYLVVRDSVRKIN